MSARLNILLKWRAKRQRPRVGAGRRLYVIGDIHGRRDLLDHLLGRIEADGGGHPDRHKCIVYLGDYVDRGPDSSGVIARVLRSPAGFATLPLLGNHEDMMLRFLEDRDVGPIWLANGGDATLASYGVAAPMGGLDGAPLATLRRQLADRLPERHRRFLQSLSLYHRERDYLLVHAGIRPGIALAQQQARDLIWIRDRFLDSPRDHGFMVVHGHSVVPEVQYHGNRIAIDTGAYLSGKLSCLVLDGAERELIQTI